MFLFGIAFPVLSEFCKLIVFIWSVSIQQRSKSCNFYLPFTSGSGPCVHQTPKPQEQNGEQAGEHRPEEDAHGAPAGGTGAGTGSWLLKR